MTQTLAQPSSTFMGELGASVKHIAASFVGKQHIATEVAAAAAHYDGLIDAIERAGWDISALERVRHALDATAQALLQEVVDNAPDMSEAEQQSFMAPFYEAIHRFAALSQRDRAGFRAEYQRFMSLHQQSMRELATETA